MQVGLPNKSFHVIGKERYPTPGDFCVGATQIKMRKLMVLIMLLSCLTACGDIYRCFRSGDIGWALKKAIRDEHRQEVVVKELTGFGWDEFYVFDPYEPTEQVCARLGLSPSECKSIIKEQSTDDGEMLIAFRSQGKIVHVEMHFRWHGDFTPAPATPFTATSAVFSVVPNGKGADGREWLRLRPKVIQKEP